MTARQTTAARTERLPAERPRVRGPLIAAGVTLGAALAGFVDGIILHQILQWHHMLSSTGDHPVTTVAGLEVNTLADGLFHGAMWLLLVVGLALLWRAARRPDVPWSGRTFLGALLAGAGGFNLIEGVINHHLLGIHHVRETGAVLAWDLGFLAVSAAILALGLWLVRPPDAATAGRTGASGSSAR
jgi:uncharacterized membrane protein